MHLSSMSTCYILDGLLILYGIVLTAMYCRLRVQTRKAEASSPQKQASGGGIYAGLTSPNTDTYETIHVTEKKQFV